MGPVTLSGFLRFFGLGWLFVAPLLGADVHCRNLVEPVREARGQARARESDREHQSLEELARQIRAARDGPIHTVDELCREALALCAADGESSLECAVRLDWSWALARSGKAALALKQAGLARNLADRAGDRSSIAEADYHLALAHWYGSELPEALEAVGRARVGQEALGQDSELATTLTLEGVIHRSRSAYDKSVASHLLALEISERIEDPVGVARSRNNLGLVYWRLGQHERALEALVAALGTFRESEDASKLASVLNNVGLIEIELDRPERALPRLADALASYEELGLLRGKSMALSNTGWAHEKLGNHELALEYHQRALHLREQLGDRWRASRSLGSIAGIHCAMNNWPDALDFFERALTEAEVSEARDEQVAIHVGLAETHEMLGDHSAALASLRRSVELREELNSSEVAKEIAELEAQHAMSTKEREVAALARASLAQELELSRHRNRQAILLFGSALLAAAVFGLYVLYRSRGHALGEVQVSHDRLQSTTERLKESEERYRTVFDDALIPKMLVDLDNRRVLDANLPAAQLCSAGIEELRGAECASVRPSWLAEALDAFEQKLGAEDRRVQEWTDDDGKQRASELWATPIELSGHRCASLTVHDITEAKRLEEERIRLDNLDSLGLLAGGIAHDFNNALAAVLGRVSVARHRVAREDSLRPLLEDAEESVRHAAHLTSQLLAFSRGGEPKRELKKVAQLLIDSVQFGLSGSNVRVEFDLDPDLWSAELDPGQFRQVVSNLVINVDQAMPDGGRLLVRACNVQLEAALSPSAGAGPFVKIELQDFGCGIPEAIQTRIFDPYFSTKDHGSGLGLATAYAVASRHHGSLQFESEVGVGTTFTLHFPASAATATQDVEVDVPLIEGAGSILVMDDDPKVQAVFRTVLEEIGYVVDVTADGREAIARWRSEADAGRRYDAVIMDLTVPGGMGGKVAMRELLRVDPSAIGIVASGYSKDPVLSNFSDAGFSGALEKPFTVDRVGTLLAQVLDARHSSK